MLQRASNHKGVVAPARQPGNAAAYAAFGRRAVPYLAVVLTGAYLTSFVDRGWVAHDEGHLGHAAERALHGQLPHVDFDETYTGGLTWLHAAIFGTFGVELLWLRWALFAASMVAVICFYRLFRRFGGPPAAAAGCVLATVWGFPNYFAALPSWWNLVLTVACVLALFKAVETDRLAYVFLAGVLTGLSLAFKQTALYVVAAGVLSILYVDQARCPRGPSAAARLEPAFLIRVVASAGAFGLVMVLLRARLSTSTVLFFAVPVAAVCWLLVADAARRRLPPLRTTTRRVGIFVAGVLLPLCMILAPYLWRGAAGQFLYGWLIAPQARTTHAALEPQSPAFLLMGAPIVAWAVLCAYGSARARRWLVAAGLLAAVLSPMLYGADFVYQSIWQSARLAIFLPVLAAAVLWLPIEDEALRRGRLFVLACVMAFWSLVQYPFSAPFYFCYVIPLAPVLALGLARTGGARWTRPLVPLALLYVVFAVVSLNRGDLGKVGVRHQPVEGLTPLGLARADLRIPPAEGAMYRRVVELVQQHRRTAFIYAAPDCPEVYFLTGSDNPTRSFYDVLGTADRQDVDSLLVPERISVVVVNHSPNFSAPPGEALLAQIRSRYAHAERVGKFEVFWNDGLR